MLDIEEVTRELRTQTNFRATPDVYNAVVKSVRKRTGGWGRFPPIAPLRAYCSAYRVLLPIGVVGRRLPRWTCSGTVLNFDSNCGVGSSGQRAANSS